MTSLYEVLKAQKMGAAIAPDYFTALWAGATGGGWHPNYTIATMQALTIAQLQTHTISELQGGEWS